jgi:hypothetical protein
MGDIYDTLFRPPNSFIAFQTHVLNGRAVLTACNPLPCAFNHVPNCYETPSTSTANVYILLKFCH